MKIRAFYLSPDGPPDILALDNGNVIIGILNDVTSEHERSIKKIDDEGFAHWTSNIEEALQFEGLVDVAEAFDKMKKSKHEFDPYKN